MPDQRIVALLGAPGSGKTTLARALVGRLTGHLPAHGSAGDLHLLDAPGHPELPGVHAALRAASAAVLVVSPVQGLDPRTVALWEACEAAELPLLVVLSQLDRPGADADEAVALAQRLLGDAVAPLHLPLHDDDGVVGGLLDLVALQVRTPGEVRPADPEHVRLVDPLREELLERVLSGGEEEAFSTWLADGDPPGLDLALPAAVARGDLQPVLVAAPVAASGTGSGVGLTELRDLLLALPPASSRSAPAAETPEGDPVHLGVDGPPVAEVIAPGLARVWSGPSTGALVAVPPSAAPGDVLTSCPAVPPASASPGAPPAPATPAAPVLAPWPGPSAQFPVGVREDADLAHRVRLDPLARLAVDPRSEQLLLWTAGPAHAELLLAGLPSLPVRLEGPRTGTLQVRLPDWSLRAVRSDVTDRGGEVLSSSEDEDVVLLRVRLPAAELAHYALALARASSATGSFTRLTGPLT